MTNRIFCTIYKDNFGLYLPSGELRQISCNNILIGFYKINMQGEEVALPTTTIPPDATTPGTQFQSSTALVQVGKIWVNTQFGDPNFFAVVKVKDVDARNTLYVDITSWNENIPKCNLVSVAQGCPSVTAISAPAIAATTATVSWTAAPGTVGVEYVNNTSSTAPTGDGTYLDGATTSVALTGLTTATTYYFWLRTICQGIRGAWIYTTYTTS